MGQARTSQPSGETRFYKGRISGTERLSHLSKVTQLLCGRGGIGTRQWGHRAQAPNPSSAPPFRPTPSPAPGHTSSCPGEQGNTRRAALSSSLPPLPTSQTFPAFTAQASTGCTWTAYPTTTCESWQAGPGSSHFIHRLVKGLIKHPAHAPHDPGTQPPPCPAASQQAQSNATQNSAAGRAGRNPSL